ncbi:MAG: TIGR00153 family protein [Gammaproteobacteria bacterium]|nr:TIGR00153 family protein [Gammaproteobacteria bacterium]
MTARSYVTKIFGKAPVRPIQQHMEKVVLCVCELEPFFKAVVEGDWSRAREIQHAIGSLENEADEIKRDIRLHLPKSVFMPVSRVDLLEMLRIQDMVANKAKDIAGLMVGREMEMPASIADDMIEYASRSIEATRQAGTAINELDELFESGFRGAEVKLVESMIRRLDEIEKHNDQQQVKLRTSLFAIEDDLNPVKVVFLYLVIDWVGHIADLAQRVGSRLEYLLAR